MAVDGIYAARAQIARALAHPVRLRIVDVLTDEGEKTVSDLTELLEVGQSSVSKHLRVMYDAGILNFEKRGLNVTYSVRVLCIADLFRCLDGILMDDLQRRQRQLKEGGANHG